jgi:hypothetical protein
MDIDLQTANLPDARKTEPQISLARLPTLSLKPISCHPAIPRPLFCSRPISYLTYFDLKPLEVKIGARP